MGEDADLELKSGKGGFPQSVLATYSAMANTNGGFVVLGVRDDGTIEGLADVRRMKKALWDTFNNRGKISHNLLTEEDVIEQGTPSGPILIVHVRRATRYERPVYKGQNPLQGTFRRNYEGDYRCSEQEVSRMLADRAEEPRDSEILQHFAPDADLDKRSLEQYRQRFSSRSPAHPWLGLSNVELLEKLGAWRQDRGSGNSGLTMAGILMFGKEDAIRDALPQYHVDYREYMSGDPKARWTDRVTLDGTWEGNIFQFSQRIIGRLSAELKLPFGLDASLVRSGESPVHVALREALVNALIHADYHGQGGIVVEKRLDGFQISNPGTLLVSFDQLLAGGVSECRNKALQKMFLMIGFAEHAGSGVDKILAGWESQHWRAPRINESMQPDRVILYLPTTSMIPPEVLERLKSRFGHEFAQLNEEEVTALVTADLEGQISNARMRDLSRKHRSDLTQMLQRLVARGFLEQEGSGRWTKYHLRSQPADLLDPKANLIGSGGGNLIGSGKNLLDSGQDLIDSGEDLLDSEEDLIGSRADLIDSRKYVKQEETGEHGRRVIWLDLSQKHLDELLRIAQLGQGKVPSTVLRQVIARLCAADYLTKAQIAELLGRNPTYLYHKYLKPMVEEGLLELRYPESKSRPGQGYRRRIRRPGGE